MEKQYFWADVIKTLEKYDRLNLAIEYLPLPAAFKEACIALRSIIREKRKSKEIYDNELFALYWIAAIDSFSKPYADKIKQPGFNVLNSIPANIVTGLPVKWHDLGYKEIPQLKKTDIKWMIEKWGEPHRHSSLIKDHHHIWDKYEDLLIQKEAIFWRSFPWG